MGGMHKVHFVRRSNREILLLVICYYPHRAKRADHWTTTLQIDTFCSPSAVSRPSVNLYVTGVCACLSHDVHIDRIDTGAIGTFRVSLLTFKKDIFRWPRETCTKNKTEVYFVRRSKRETLLYWFAVILTGHKGSIIKLCSETSDPQ